MLFQKLNSKFSWGLLNTKPLKNWCSKLLIISKLCLYFKRGGVYETYLAMKMIPQSTSRGLRLVPKPTQFVQ